MSFHYQTSFTLDKAHYIECFQASVTPAVGIKPYTKALVLLVIGLIASSISQEQGYLALFIIMLAVVEALSVRFQKTWWLWRQLLSKAANSDVKLTINEQSIAIDGRYQQLTINWSQVTNISETEQGFVLQTEQGKHYLTKSCLNSEAIVFITGKRTDQ